MTISQPVTSIPGSNSLDGGAYVATLVEPVVNTETASTRPTGNAEPTVNGLGDVNPYAARVVNGSHQGGDSRKGNVFPLAKLRLINSLLICFQATFILGFVSLFLAAASSTLSVLALAIPLMLLVNWGCIILLAYHSRSLASAIFCAVLSFTPFLSLLIWPSVYDRSRKVLKDHGYKVGWWKMELDQDAYDQLSSESALAMATPSPEKKERSTISLVVTYALIGLLVGAIWILANP